MASESGGQGENREQGHRNHFRLLQEEGRSWSGREPNTLFQNRGDGTFDEVGNVLGVAALSFFLMPLVTRWLAPWLSR